MSIFKFATNIQTLLRLSGSGHIFEIIRTLFSLYRNFPDLGITGHISRSSKLFLDYPDTFSRLSGHFLQCPETFQFIQTLFRSSRHFPLDPDTLLIIWILCIATEHFPNYPEILQPIMNLSQKLSGFTITFWLAMLPCHPGFSDSNLIRHRRMKHFGLEHTSYLSFFLHG